MTKKEKYLVFVIVVIIGIIFFVLLRKENNLPQEVQFERPDTGSTTERIRLAVDGIEEIYEISIYATEKSKQEIENEFALTLDYIDEMIRGENQDLDNVTNALVFPTKLEQTNAKIRWSSTQEHIVTKEGVVYREKIDTPTVIEVYAEISIGEEKQEVCYEITLLPYEEESIQRKMSDVKEWLLILEEQTRTETNLEFPSEIGGVKILRDTETNTIYIWLVLIPITGALLVFGKKKEKEKEEKLREQKLLAEYPNLVTKLTMYIGAGMSIRNAWERIAKEYDGLRKEDNELAESICFSVGELRVGKGENIVLEAFGEKIGLRPYKRMVSILVGQSRTGGGELKEALKQEVQEAWEVHKEQVHYLGEEAETKLIFPMIGMMVIVFCIVLIPAFLSIQL